MQSPLRLKIFPINEQMIEKKYDVLNNRDILKSSPDPPEKSPLKDILAFL